MTTKEKDEQELAAAKAKPSARSSTKRTLNFMQRQGVTELVETSTARAATPKPTLHGSEEKRGLMDVPHSPLYEGRFGRMFRNLPSLFFDDIEVLNKLATFMVEQTGGRGIDNPDIPSAYTYLGQFIDHDITFDPTSKLQRDNDPNALVNFRTPRLDLDSLYGSGPADDPYLYQSDSVRLRIGLTFQGEDDCPRTALDRIDGTPSTEKDRAVRRALIGDPRNDENIIINQLHLAFLKYHNAVVTDLERDGVTGEERLFNEARRIVRWHYQWMVIYDFLARVVGREVVDDILKVKHYTVHRLNGYSPHDDGRTVKADLRFFEWRYQPYIPVEFSGAAYRFGHSMVRGAYKLNNVTQFIPIFSLTPGDEFGDLRGFRERPPFWQIEWQRFLTFPESTIAPDQVQMSVKIDPHLAKGLGELPFAPLNLPSLAARNLMRGQALGLPSGQTVARAMGMPEGLVLKGRHMGLTGELERLFANHTPLWFYILREAEKLADGRKLGPVGGRIVAEVLIGLIYGDSQSFLRVHPGWTPVPCKYGAPEDGMFGLPDLFRHAGALIVDPSSPVG